MHRRDMLVLIAVSAVFGASFALIRVAAPHLGPLTLAGLRVALGAPVPLAILLWRRELGVLRRHVKELLLVGALLGAIPFTLIALAELYVDASLAAVINATTPIWGLAVAAAWLGQPIVLRKLTGAMIGLAGVATCVGVSVVRIDGWVLLAVGASLLAALSYAIGSTYVARRLSDTPSAALAAGQQIGATLLLAAPAAATATGSRPPLTALIAVCVLGLICTGTAFVAYFDLIHRVGPVSAVTVTLLAPVFGIAWAVGLLGEQISLGLVVGVALVLVGVNLIVRPRPVKAGEALTPSSDGIRASRANDTTIRPSWRMKSRPLSRRAWGGRRT